MLARIGSVREELSKISSDIDAILKEIASLQKKRVELKNQLETLVNNLQDLKKHRDELKQTLREINTRIAELKQQYNRIMTQLRRMSESMELQKLTHIIKTKQKRALEKMERGERLTMEDLYFIFGVSQHE